MSDYTLCAYTICQHFHVTISEQLSITNLLQRCIYMYDKYYYFVKYVAVKNQFLGVPVSLSYIIYPLPIHAILCIFKCLLLYLCPK